MSQLTKQQLQVENSTSFPNNTTNYITPELLRTFNSNIIDTLVTSQDTASFATTGSNTFTGKQIIDADNFLEISGSKGSSAFGDDLGVSWHVQRNSNGAYAYVEPESFEIGSGSSIVALTSNPLFSYGVGGTKPAIMVEADTTAIVELITLPSQTEWNDGTTTFNYPIIVSGSIIATGNVYAPNITGSSQGVQGTQGANGIQGNAGTNGTNGTNGAQGIQGLQGVQGVQGTLGQTGPIGIQGYIGLQGIKGNDGVQGVQGVQGIIGIGTQGVQGAQGVAGGGTIDTASFATTGSNIFTGNNEFNGGLTSSTDILVNNLTVGNGGGNIASNIAIGNSALVSNTTAIGNTAVGAYTLVTYQTSGNGYNTAVGYASLNQLGLGGGVGASTVNNNTAIGNQAASFLVLGTRNTVVGSFAMASANNVSRNTGLGRGVFSALNNNSIYNSAIGHNALFTLQTGSNNVFVHGGSVTGEGIIEGNNNTVLGQDASLPATMESNTIIGRNITGLSSPLSNNVILADGAGNIALQKNSSGGAIIIGSGIEVTGSATFSELTGSLGDFSASISNRINNVSGSGGTVDTSSLATTGSNTFVGNQIITGSLLVSSSNSIDVNVIGRVSITGANSGGGTPIIYVSSSESTTQIGRRNVVITDTLNGKVFNISTSAGGFIDLQDPNTANNIGLTLSGSQFGTDNWDGPSIYGYNNVDGRTGYIGFQSLSNYTDGRVTVLKPLVALQNLEVTGSLTVTSSTLNIDGSGNVTASGFLANGGGSPNGFSYNQPSTGSVNGVWNTSYNRDSIQLYQYQGQNRAFNLNLTSDQFNGISGSQFLFGLQTNGSGASTFGGSTYLALISGSLSQSSVGGTEIPGADKLVNNAGGLEITYTYANAGFKGKVYVNQGLYVSASGTPTALTTNGDTIISGSAIINNTLNVSNTASFKAPVVIENNADLYVYGNKQFNVGAFQSNVTQTGSANVSQSMQLETTDVSYGVSVVNSSQMLVANKGVYDIEFSTQVLSSTGADSVYIWLKKNGVNVPTTATEITLANNEALVAAWNFVTECNSGDYYELCWQNTNGNAQLKSQIASGNIPGIPAVIVTITQVR